MNLPLNPSLTTAWTKLLGGSSYDSANALTTGSDGAIHVSGNGDAFITKYLPDGTKSWTKLLGTAWATWIIARLGGWSGYRSQKPPGISTLVCGLRQFESFFQGWKLALGQDVCTP
jgi:hypothetical protein